MKHYIERPMALTLLLAFIVGLGVWFMLNLPLKMYPNVVKPGFRVNFNHSEIVNPEDFYRIYGEKIEKQIRDLVGIETVQSQYSRGWGGYRIEGKWDFDDEVLKEKLTNILLSQTGSDPKFSFDIRSQQEQASAGLMISVNHPQLSSTELTQILDHNLFPVLKSVEGVKSVGQWGFQSDEFILRLDREKLLQHGLNPQTLESKIVAHLKTQGIGALVTSSTDRGIRIIDPSEILEISKILELPIVTDLSKNFVLKLKDIGQLEIFQKRQNDLYRLNGKEAQFITVRMDPMADVKKTSDAVIDKLTEFRQQVVGFDFGVLVNPSEFIVNSIENLMISALVGGAVAILIIWLFLGQFSNTLIIAISIPFCIVLSFSLMAAFGLTINIISLGGMAIGVGMIVDSSIVTLENLFRRLVESPKEPRVSVISSGTREVVVPVLASILTSIAVFLPIVFTSSYTKSILGDLAKVVVFLLSASVLAALILVPVLAYHFLAPSNFHHFGTVQRVAGDWASRFVLLYQRSLSYLLCTRTRSLILVASSFAVFLGSLTLLPSVRRELIATPETRLLDIMMEFPNNDDVALTKKHATEIEQFLKSRDEVIAYSTYFWQPSFGFITAELKSRKFFAPMKALIQEHFPGTAGVNITPQKWDPGALPIPTPRNLNLHIKGPNPEEIALFQEKINQVVSANEGRSRTLPWPEQDNTVSVSFFDWVKNSDVLNYFVEIATLGGRRSTDIFYEGRRQNLRLGTLNHQTTKYFEELDYLPIPYDNQIVPLKALAKVQMVSESHLPLYFLNGIQMGEMDIYITGKGMDLSEREKKEHSDKIKEAVSKISPPERTTLSYEDPNKEITESYESFKWALIISVALVFLILAFMFNSFKYPTLILSSIPLSLIGVIVGLRVADSTVSLNSMLGVILLCGLVVNNGILMIDFYLRRREDPVESKTNPLTLIVEVSTSRLRAIMMTTLTTLLGVAPIALAIGEGGEVLQPMGITIFFGLLTSTFLTLIIIPALIRLIDHWKVEALEAPAGRLQIRP